MEFKRIWRDIDNLKLGKKGGTSEMTAYTFFLLALALAITWLIQKGVIKLG